MKNLPIGIQTFEKIINKNLLYIDKTKIIYKLINEGSFYFLSRPRRFGKSLLLSTLQEIFSGNKELFKDLYIYDKISWEKFPVIHLSMSNLKGTQDLTNIYESALLMLHNNAASNSVSMPLSKQPALAFSQLIQELSKINKVVVLIDEYDKPIIDHINDLSIAKQNREFLRDFYSVLKDNDQNINFCLLTGVSKFSKVSIFSGLNNLRDITINDSFSTICGITQNEMEDYFNDRFEDLGNKLNLDDQSLKQKIKTWYNGYSWDAKNTVYNPFSILNFFADGTFKNYWFSSGTPTFLIEKIIQDKIQVDELENNRIGLEIFESFDLENLNLISLLFQTGYLTIISIDYDEGICTLNYPNQEVKRSFLVYIAAHYFNTSVINVRPLYIDLIACLTENNIKKFINSIKSIIAGIPYQLHIQKEAYYHSLFYLIMELMGIDMDIEQNTSKGRIDGIIEYDNNIYIIEFKYLSENKNIDELLNTALNQIKTKEYFAPYLIKNKPIKYLAVAINKETVEYKLEEHL